MRSLRRTLSLGSIVALAVCLPALASCAGGSSSSSGPVTITFQDQFNDAESAKFATLVSQFEAQNSNITVTVVRDNAQSYYDKLVTQIIGGAGPDIARVEPPKAAQYVGAGYAVPVDPYISSTTADQFFPGTVTPLQKNGHLYGVPQDVATLVLYYRTDMFQAAGISQPPATWDDLVADAQKLTKAPSQYGLGLFGGWGAFEFYPWFWQAGGEMLGQDSSGKTVATFNSPGGVKALQFWTDLENKYKVMPPGAANLTEDDVKGPFIAGKIAMFTSGPWNVSAIKAAGIEGKWAIAPLPKGDQAASVLGGLDLIILKNSKHQAEAGKFLAWLMQDSVQKDWAQSLGFIPIKKSLYNDPAFSDPLTSQFAAALQVSRSRPTVPQAGQVDDAFGKAVQAALSGAQTPQEALNAAAQQANQALSQ